MAWMSIFGRINFHEPVLHEAFLVFWAYCSIRQWVAHRFAAICRQKVAYAFGFSKRSCSDMVSRSDETIRNRIEQFRWRIGWCCIRMKFECPFWHACLLWFQPEKKLWIIIFAQSERKSFIVLIGSKLKTSKLGINYDFQELLFYLNFYFTKRARLSFSSDAWHHSRTSLLSISWALSNSPRLNLIDRKLRSSNCSFVAKFNMPFSARLLF